MAKCIDLFRIMFLELCHFLCLFMHPRHPKGHPRLMMYVAVDVPVPGKNFSRARLVHSWDD